jgi:hypothetical protein
MKREVIIAAVILVANLVLATLMYLTVGWHFIRDYEEVGNFLVVPFAVGKAASRVGTAHQSLDGSE